MTDKKNDIQTCSTKDLYFPVEIRDEEMESNSEYSKRVVGIIDGTETLLNQCSNIYELVPNKDIFPSIETVLNENKVEYKVTYRHINHVKFYVNYNITDKRFAYKMKGTNDSIQPRLDVMHSYNGKVKYHIAFGYYRLICTNGLTIPVAEMKKYNLSIVGKHTQQIIRSFEQLDTMLNQLINNTDGVSDILLGRFETLGGSWVAKPEDRLKEILNATKITAVENNNFNTVNDILSRVMVEANSGSLGYKGKVNDWLIYNGINQYINDESRYKTAPETRLAKDQKVLDFMLHTS